MSSVSVFRMSNSERYWKLVNKLIDHGITTEEGWYAFDRAEYMYYLERNPTGFKVRRIMRDVVRHMAWTKTLYDFVIQSHMVDDIRPNPIYKLLLKNKLEPAEVGTMLVRWAGLFGSRNTVWLKGGENTAVSMLGHAIAYTSPLTGYANYRDPSNPFRHCSNKTLIVWEGTRLQSSNWESCLRVFKGETGGEGLYKTPVLVMSQCDMGEVVGNSGKTRDHASEIYESMYVIELTEPFDGLITCHDVKDFFTWSCDNKVDHIK